ncbi:MAG: hypothetical protein RIN56_12305 [Sporomusaceae bacterium]|nr:hypothetical protein [Sporomusaceae bacterium]
MMNEIPLTAHTVRGIFAFVRMLNKRAVPESCAMFSFVKEQSMSRASMHASLEAGSRDAPEGVSACTQQAIVRRGRPSPASFCELDGNKGVSSWVNHLRKIGYFPSAFGHNFFYEFRPFLVCIERDADLVINNHLVNDGFVFVLVIHCCCLR